MQLKLTNAETNNVYPNYNSNFIFIDTFFSYDKNVIFCKADLIVPVNRYN